MSPIGEAFVVVRPVVHDFRGEVTALVSQNLGSVAVPIPVTPQLAAGTAANLTWQRIAGGAVIPVAMPVTPVIPPGEAAKFRSEAAGLRGLLLGGSQFAAARALGISSAAAGLFVFGKAALSAVKSAATLEQELDVFAQVSGATADQMARVAAEARTLGADISLPGVSSGEAAATMTELAKAGLSVDDVLAGTRGTLQLATAANIDFASSAELAANALNAFQLPGADAVHVADLLAGAANAAQGDISSMGIALSQSAAVAHQAGLSLEDTVTFITELAKAGIQGSDAGTSLRVSLLRLIAPGGQAKKILDELGVAITDAQGNVRTDVFEQLRVSMLRLDPATRNAALATVFGTDAVRAAAIFTRDGARGFDELATQVTRQGQAAETAAARTEGLAGKAGALSSNIETLGTDIGTIAIPLLSDLADAANVVVGDFDVLINKADELGTHLGGINLGPFGKLGGVIGRGIKDAVKAPFAPLHSSVDLLRGDFRGALKDLEPLVPGIGELVRALEDGADASNLFGNAFGVVGDALGREANLFGNTAGIAANAAGAGAEEGGKQIGRKFTKGVADGIIAEDQRAIGAARTTLADVIEEGNKAVAAAQTQGQQAIAAAALDAKQNLQQIGRDLGQQVIQILDTGPLAQRIKVLQASLDAGRAALQRGNLRKDLRDAEDELARAQASVSGGLGPLSAEQKAAEARFLDPFREKVKDAQAALEEFNTQGSIDKLTARLRQQQQDVAKSLDGIIARFNARLIDGPALTRRLGQLLQRNVGPISEAGKKQGFAFNQAFAAEVAGANAQVAAIIGGPQTTRTGAEPRVVSPGQVAAQARTQLADAIEQAGKSRFNAQQGVAERIRDYNKDLVTEAKKSSGLLAKIHTELTAPKVAPTKPSVDVKKTPTGGRTGGR